MNDLKNNYNNKIKTSNSKENLSEHQLYGRGLA